MLRVVLLGVVSMMGADAYETPTLSSDGTVHTWWRDTHSRGNNLHAINADGTTKWIFNASTAGLVVYLMHREGPNGTIYVTGECDSRLPCPSRLLALDGSDGSVQWTYQSLTETDDRYNQHNEYYKPHDLLVSKDGTLYLSSESAGLPGLIVVEVLDANGMRKWSFDNAGHTHPHRPKRFLISPDNGILIQNMNENTNGTMTTVDIQSLSLVDGSVKWTLPFLSYWSPIMTFAEDGSIFVIQDHTIDLHSSSFEKSLIRLNGEDGGVLWNTSMSALVSPYDDPQHRHNDFFFVGSEVVYVNGLLGEGGTCNLGVFKVEGGSQRNLPCLDMSMYATDLAFLPKLEQIGSAEDAFVITNQHFDVSWAEASVLAYSGADGSGLWNVSIDDLEFAYGSRLSLAVRHSPRIVFAFSGNHLHCISSGAERWNMTMGTPLSSAVSDPIVGGDGTTFVFFGDVLLAITSDGMEKWRYSPEVEMLVV